MPSYIEEVHRLVGVRFDLSSYPFHDLLKGIRAAGYLISPDDLLQLSPAAGLSSMLGEIVVELRFQRSELDRHHRA